MKRDWDQSKNDEATRVRGWGNDVRTLSRSFFIGVLLFAQRMMLTNLTVPPKTHQAGTPSTTWEWGGAQKLDNTRMRSTETAIITRG